MQDLHRGQQPVLTVGRGNAPLLVAGATTFPPRRGDFILRYALALFFPLNRGKSGAALIGGGERSEPISRMLIMPYDTERLNP